MSLIIVLPRQLTMSMSHAHLQFDLLVCMGKQSMCKLKQERPSMMIMLRAEIPQRCIQDDKTNGMSVRH